MQKIFFHFCVDVSLIIKSASKSICKLVLGYMFIQNYFYLNNNTLFSCLGFSFAIEIDTSFANLDFRSFSNFI